jgi:hypothetical protein
MIGLRADYAFERLILGPPLLGLDMRIADAQLSQQQQRLAWIGKAAHFRRGACLDQLRQPTPRFNLQLNT